MDLRRLHRFIRSLKKDKKEYKIFKTPHGTIISHSKNSNVRYTMEIEKVDFIKNNLKEGMIFMDIGACQGYFSILANDLKARVYAFEPSRNAFQELKTNCILNGIKGYYNYAISDKPSILRFEESKISIGQGRLSKEGYEVKGVSISSFFEPKGIYPNIIKIDVEGHENEVLKGLEPLLTYSKPIILLDIHSEGNKEFMFIWAKKNNYKVEKLGKKKPDYILR